MKTLRTLILQVALGAAVTLALNAASSIATRLGILAQVAAHDDGCIFHKPRSRWSKDDLDLLERRIRRIQAMPDGKGATPSTTDPHRP